VTAPRGPRMARLVALGGSSIALISASAESLPPYPPTPKYAVVDHDAAKPWIDPYRWLENDNDMRVIRWASAQRDYARRYLQAQPGYAGLRSRVAQLARTGTTRFGLSIQNGHWFYEELTPPQAQASLVMREGVAGTERVLYDPVIAAHGAVPDAIESVFPAPDGSKVAFTTQPGGSEQETLHVVDAATGTLLDDTIPHAGGGVSPSALAWDTDNKGFLYARYPLDGPPGERHFNVALYHHALGSDPAADPYVFGHGLSRVAEYVLLRSQDGSRTAALVEPGDSGDYAVWVSEAGAPFVQAATEDDHVKSGAFLGTTLLLRTSRALSTFDVVSLEPGQKIDDARTFIPAGALPIEGITVAAGHVFARELDGGDSSIHVYDSSGAESGTMPLPPHVTVNAIAGDPSGSDAIVGYTTYGVPSRWVRYDASSGDVSDTGIETTAAGDYSSLVVTRELVASADGAAKIPLSILSLPSAAKDGSAPTIMTAYGGYGISMTPAFIGTWLAWLEQGGVYAVAGVRGGGEYGEAWHRAAVHATKTKSADDLASCARWLAANGYGDVKHLGIIGGSDGGFLMGLAITRDPSLYRAVVGQAGIYDIPRWQRSPNGASNIPEFGDARVASDFTYIMKQSPYQNVRDGVRYPAVLLMTGENDPRVTPLNSRKMVARLQDASASGYPVLLIQTAGEGHGFGDSYQQRVDRQTAVLAFFASQLGR
jgi:prolyl oligopeptidase